MDEGSFLSAFAHSILTNELLLKISETDFLLLGTPQPLKKFDWFKSLKLADSVIELTDSAHDLDIVFNCTVSLTDCQSTVWTCFREDIGGGGHAL